MNMKRSIQITGWSALAVLALGLLGCEAYVDPMPVASPGVVVESDSGGIVYADVGVAPVEVDIATYPQTYYEGRPYYFYGDHWYYRGEGGRWAYDRREPAELNRQRGYIQQAPEARRGEQRAPEAPRGEERAPEARRAEAPRQAPPAQRPEEQQSTQPRRPPPRPGPARAAPSRERR